MAPTELHWECNAAKTAGDILGNNGWDRVAIIADQGVLRSGAADQFLYDLATAERQIFELDIAEPDIDFLDSVANEFRSLDPSVILGLGGGSAMDVAKGLSALLTNPGSAVDYQGFNLVPNPGVPSVMVPTTAGTGSEVTWTAVFTNRRTMRKLGINSRHILPRYALLDPDLTLSLPPGVTMSSGMDALSHAIEAYTARTGNAVARMMCLEAFRLLSANLPQVLRKPNDRDARSNMQLGSTLAGWAIFNAGTGACHSVAYALGTHCGVPHGVAIAMLLPHVMRINEAKCPGLYAPLYNAVREGQDGTSSERSNGLIALIDDVLKLGDFTTCLSDFGVVEADLDFLTERGLELTSALSNNPAGFGETDARSVLESAL